MPRALALDRRHRPARRGTGGGERLPLPRRRRRGDQAFGDLLRLVGTAGEEKEPERGRETARPGHITFQLPSGCLQARPVPDWLPPPAETVCWKSRQTAPVEESA